LLLQAVRELKAENEGLREQMESQLRRQAEKLENLKAELEQARAVLRGIQH
jgi:prefoldin subunit 5